MAKAMITPKSDLTIMSTLSWQGGAKRLQPTYRTCPAQGSMEFLPGIKVTQPRGMIPVATRRIFSAPCAQMTHRKNRCLLPESPVSCPRAFPRITLSLFRHPPPIAAVKGLRDEEFLRSIKDLL